MPRIGFYLFTFGKLSSFATRYAISSATYSGHFLAPCSQSCSVRLGMFKASQNFACDSPVDCRISLTLCISIAPIGRCFICLYYAAMRVKVKCDFSYFDCTNAQIDSFGKCGKISNAPLHMCYPHIPQILAAVRRLVCQLLCHCFRSVRSAPLPA